ncbi:MAG: CNP1-like family protein [Rhodocyclaceae bacterium]|nr:CNP1-like family protein [Rhodocyclaceae bacterium]
MSRFKTVLRCCLAGSCLAAAVAHADVGFRNYEDPDAVKWVEGEVILPAFPEEGRLAEFYVSAVATNRFFIDTAGLSVGKDGVVRYVLVVKTAGGATNVTFEGIRCGAREYRLYAAGRADRTWARSRTDEWRPIENKPVNRHHAALDRELFCPLGVAIFDVKEGLEALRLGRNPRAPER